MPSEQKPSLADIMLQKVLGLIPARVKEDAINLVGGSPLAGRIFDSAALVPPDRPYLKQYLRPQEDVLKPQTLRPSALTNADPSLPWRQSSTSDEFTGRFRPKVGDDASPEDEDRSPVIPLEEIFKLRPGQIMEKVMILPKDMQMVSDPYDEPFVGLGHYTGSIGRDQDGPFYSVYDKWDFNSPVLKPLVRQLMDRMGKPFHIYDRFDIQPSDDEPAYKATLKRRTR